MIPRRQEKFGAGSPHERNVVAELNSQKSDSSTIHNYKDTFGHACIRRRTIARCAVKDEYLTQGEEITRESGRR